MLSGEFIDPEEQIVSSDFIYVESFLKEVGLTEIGWHYITDITWIYSVVKHWRRDYKVLDAGGGLGVLQYFLAELGFNITNIDLNLNKPQWEFRRRYNINVKKLDSYEPTSYKEFLDKEYNEKRSNRDKKYIFIDSLKDIIRRTPLIFIYRLLKKNKNERKNNYTKKVKIWNNKNGMKCKPGRIQWIQGNLCSMPEIPDGTFDAVVSLSVLEHIPLEHLHAALNEIERVSKPNASWAVTISGTEKPQTWFHELSQSNCFSISDLKDIFKVKSMKDVKPQEILKKYINCSYLKDNLASFYYKSDKNGMPWGKWNPLYIPVGLKR